MTEINPETPRRVEPTTAESFPGSAPRNGVSLAWYGEWAAAYGHLDAKAFAAAVDQYQGWETPECRNNPGDVEHVWAVHEIDDSLPEDEDWHRVIRWVGVTEQTEHAFPVTVLEAGS
jgi:hypothetical protein